MLAYYYRLILPYITYSFFVQLIDPRLGVKVE